MATHDSVPEAIGAEIDRATSGEINAYLQGASRDGTFNRSHNTLRISQADVRWLHALRRCLERLGKRSWIYRVFSASLHRVLPAAGPEDVS